MSSSDAAAIINPKDCVYGCKTRIYWNTLTREYWEVFTKKKHMCPNRSILKIINLLHQQYQLIIMQYQSQQTYYNSNYKNNYNEQLQLQEIM